MATLKKRLESNKVYFETVGASLLGIMAVIVSCVAIAVSCQTNRIASQQAQFMEAEYLPVFDIRRGPVEQNPDTNVFPKRLSFRGSATG